MKTSSHDHDVLTDSILIEPIPDFRTRCQPPETVNDPSLAPMPLHDVVLLLQFSESSSGRAMMRSAWHLPLGFSIILEKLAINLWLTLRMIDGIKNGIDNACRGIYFVNGRLKLIVLGRLTGL